MDRAISIRQVEFVLEADKHNPLLSNSEFLKTEGIVPTEWKVSEIPTYMNIIAMTAPLKELSFRNGISIVHQSNRINFFEDTRTKNIEDLELPQIISRYIEKLPQDNYQTVSISISGYASFNTQNEARNCLLEALLNPNNQHETDRCIVQARVNFYYQFNRGRLSLMIQDGMLDLPNRQWVSALIFSACFPPQSISRTPEGGQLHVLSQINENWQIDIRTYKEIVGNKFLKRS
jgi:hypothetical protein